MILVCNHATLKAPDFENRRQDRETGKKRQRFWGVKNIAKIGDDVFLVGVGLAGGSAAYRAVQLKALVILTEKGL